MEKEVKKLLERYETSLPESLVHKFTNKEYHEGVKMVSFVQKLFLMIKNTILLLNL